MNRLRLFFLFVFLAPIAVLAQSNEEFLVINKSLSKENVREVYARTSGGSLTAVGVPAAESRIEMYVRASDNRSRPTKEEIERRLKEDYDIEVSVSGGKVTAVAKPKSFNLSSRKNLSINFRIYVPKDVDTDLSTSGGSIDMKGLAGSQNFSTSGGSLRVDDLSGKINGKTSGGSISVSNSRDNISLSTSGGSINAENCSGVIELSTSGGGIELVKLKGEIRAKTSGGTIRGEGIMGELITHTSGGSIKLRDMAASIDASTSGGNIDMEVKEIGKYLTASNSGGNIQIRMPSDKGMNLKLRAEHIHVSSLKNFSGDQDDHKMVGKINGGGVPVDVSTSGSVTLTLD